MTSIAHISDLHFGAVNEKLVSALRHFLNDLKPDLIAVTGDLTQAGRKREFHEAAKFLGELESDKLIVPGNHDVPVYNLMRRFGSPWSRYRSAVSDEVNPVKTLDEITVIGLNSARRAGLYSDWSRGRLSRQQLTRTRLKLQNVSSGLKAVALHHPLTTSAEDKAGRYAVGRAAEAMAMFSSHKLDLLFTGHVHHSSAELLEHDGWSHVVSRAGTATSTRTRREPAAFSLLKIADEKINVTVHHDTGDNAFSASDTYSFCKEPEGWRTA